MRLRVSLAVTAIAVLATPLAAQTLHGSLAFGGGSVRSTSLLGSTEEALQGIVVGGEARLRVGRVWVDGAYREGSIKTTDDTETRDYADGHMFLRVETFPGVVASVGPHARAYITNTGTQRWLFWSVRLRGERALIAPAIAGYIELWHSLGANVNVSETFDRATGGDVGMTVRLPRSKFWGRIGYDIERAWLSGSARKETVEGVSLVLGFGSR